MFAAAEDSRPQHRFGLKQIALGLLLVGLGALAALAVLREMARSPSSAATAPAASAYAGTVSRPARTAAEEKYAADLWAIHEGVKASAVKMTFAGLSYKMGDTDKTAVKTKVTPLTKVFEDAQAKLDALEAPASLQKQHDQYAEALKLYKSASLEMVKVAQDGKDEHLIKAQAMSYNASENLLRVGDVLWPGENRPN